MRQSLVTKADDERQARANRKGATAQECGEELAQAVLQADLDDEESLRSSVEQIAAIATNARVFLLEAIQNLRTRKSLAAGTANKKEKAE